MSQTSMKLSFTWFMVGFGFVLVLCVCFGQKALLGVKEKDVSRTQQPSIHQHKNFKYLNLCVGTGMGTSTA